MGPRKANQPTLTRPQIVSAAIGVVDRDGLKGLSMRRLAEELGMSPMALYYHVPNKSALYDLIFEAVLVEVDLSGDDPAQPAEDRLIAAAHAVRQALLGHPKAMPLVLSRSLRTEGQLRPIEHIVGVMFEAGMSPQEAMAAVNIMGHYIFGATSAYANHLTDNEFHDDVSREEFTATVAQLPNMRRIFEEGDSIGFDAEFDRGVRIIVRGLLGREW